MQRMERERVREFQSTHGCFVCIAHSLYQGIKNDTAQSVFSLWNGQEVFHFMLHSQPATMISQSQHLCSAQREEQQDIYGRWEIRHQFYFHYPAEHQERDHIALKERNSREEMLCVCGHALKIFTDVHVLFRTYIAHCRFVWKQQQQLQQVPYDFGGNIIDVILEREAAFSSNLPPQMQENKYSCCIILLWCIKRSILAKPILVYFQGNINCLLLNLMFCTNYVLSKPVVCEVCLSVSFRMKAL